MAQWMDRRTSGFTQMGGEGAGWIGESAFSADEHVFQNIGDGTYFHSGLLAIRASVAARTNITFKILYNDAVAMTGGQPIDGPLDVPRITRQVHAEGVERIVVVTDEPGKYPRESNWATGVYICHRDKLKTIQEELRKVAGTTVLVYDQSCAAEKRRRRRRGVMPTPVRRLWIHEEVCEGCGDCGVQSNCVAVIPVETGQGRKRTIDQFACNRDYSCAQGFCPSFVSVLGGELRQGTRSKEFESVLNSPVLEPDLTPICGNYSIVLTGVGGTGVVTVGALVGMAAHLSGKGCSVLDMAGLAQKGGPVTSHIILAETPAEITATHVAEGGTNLLLGCDVVTAGALPTLRKLRSGTLAIINTYQMMGGNFTREPNVEFPLDELLQSIKKKVGAANLHQLDAFRVAAAVFSDTVAANLLILGYAFQLGGLPLPSHALERAIELNGKAVEMNRGAFRLGRAAAARPEEFRKILLSTYKQLHVAKPESVEKVVSEGETFLSDYQSRQYALRYRNLVERAVVAETATGTTQEKFASTVARVYWKLLAYKDEYEVARLFVDPSFRRQLDDTFEAGYQLRFHLAPPIFSARDQVTGRPRKREFGRWMWMVFRLLAACKGLRGSRLDPFSHSADRKLERRLIKEYESTIEELIVRLSRYNLKEATEIAALPLEIRGFGPVKAAAAEVASQKQLELWRKFELRGGTQRAVA
jgi:indolepyruvate ferredoxin oxidoreductase